MTKKNSIGPDPESGPIVRARRAIILLVAAVALTAGGLYSLRPVDNASFERPAGSSGTSHDIRLTAFDGEKLSLSDYKSRPLVLNFWASWCPPCIAEMPDFEKVHQELADKVAFLGVNQRDSREAAEQLAQKTGVTYRLAEDPDGRLFDSFGLIGMPATIFIDANGKVVDVIVGQVTAGLLREKIGRLFGVRVHG